MRRRVYTRNFEGAAEAEKLRTDFYAKPVSKTKVFSWRWPTKLVEAGECLGTLYRSDKWKQKGEFDDYKHKSEAEQRLFIVPGKLAQIRSIELPIVGPTDAIRHELMPETFAELALFTGFQVRLYQKDGSRYYLPDGDEGLYEFTINHAKLGAGKCKDGTTFLVVYHEEQGPYCFVFGVELNVEKDGIVG